MVLIEKWKNFFKDLQEELLELAEVDPDKSTIEERWKIKTLIENQQFSEDRYLADKYECEEIDLLTELELSVYGEKKKINDLSEVKNKDMYSEQEWNLLTKLGSKEFLIHNHQILLLQIVDILYAFLYEYRVTEGEFTSESGWSINKLSATLSTFVEMADVKQTLISSIRRSLIFPLYRNYQLSIKIKEDLVKMLKEGKIPMLKSLLKIKHLFERYEPRYLLNTLYVDDFCLYLQSVKDAEVSKIAQEIEASSIIKQDLALNLEEIEKVAEEDLNEATKWSFKFKAVL